jgi:hypothetical protein
LQSAINAHFRHYLTAPDSPACHNGSAGRIGTGRGAQGQEVRAVKERAHRRRAQRAPRRKGRAIGGVTELPFRRGRRFASLLGRLQVPTPCTAHVHTAHRSSRLGVHTRRTGSPGPGKGPSLGSGLWRPATGCSTVRSRPMRRWRLIERDRATTSTGATCWCWNRKPSPPDAGFSALR